MYFFIIHIVSGQIITTSAEVTLNGGLVRESPQNPLNSGLGIILVCPEYWQTERFSFLHWTKSRYGSKTFFEIDFALPRRRDLERSGKWGRSMKWSNSSGPRFVGSNRIAGWMRLDGLDGSLAEDGFFPWFFFMDLDESCIFSWERVKKHLIHHVVTWVCDPQIWGPSNYLGF